MEYVKNDRDSHLLYEWRDPTKEKGIISLDFDPPLVDILFDDPSWQLEIGGYRCNIQEWDITRAVDAEGNLIKIDLKYTGKVAQQRHAANFIQVQIRKPESPGRYWPITGGPTRATVIHGMLNRKEPPDEIECPNCSEDLYPVPDKCPHCGEEILKDIPTLGELVDQYGRDARLDIHTGYADADLDVKYTLSDADAEAENKKKRKAHDEKEATYQRRIEAWRVMMQPFDQKRSADKETKDRAELKRLQTKYPEATA